MVTMSQRDKQRPLTIESRVDAATAIFEERGYLDATVDDIVRRAGASRPTFYACFDGKAVVAVGLSARPPCKNSFSNRAS